MEIILSFLICSLVLSLGYLIKFLVKKIGFLNTKYDNLLKKNILDDLDLATTEQLFDEIKKRHDRPFILIFPEDRSKKMGIKIDVSSLSPEQLMEILKMSLTVVSNQVNRDEL